MQNNMNENFKEILIYDALKNNYARCNMCQHKCEIKEGGGGYCKTVINSAGKLFSSIYGIISSMAADPIEKKPVYHYKPGSKCFSVGSLGCNFRCCFCQNHEIACVDALELLSLSTKNNISYVSPERFVKLAIENDCHGVAWTYNEPSIWLNYILDCAKLCKEKSLYTVYVTNGYATIEHLDIIAPYLDVYRVDIKSTNNEFYKKLTGANNAEGILSVAIRAKHKWNMHIECVTNIIPGWNDSDISVALISRWIFNNLGKSTPWHITRFFPYGELSDVPPTPLDTLNHAYNIAKDVGLEHVYLGNIHSGIGSNTYCSKCGNIAIKRYGYNCEVSGLTKEGKCKKDCEDINVIL